MYLYIQHMQTGPLFRQVFTAVRSKSRENMYNHSVTFPFSIKRKLRKFVCSYLLNFCLQSTTWIYTNTYYSNIFLLWFLIYSFITVSIIYDDIKLGKIFKMCLLNSDVKSKRLMTTLEVFFSFYTFS